MIATFEVQKKKRNFGGFFFVVENFVVRSLAGHVPAGAGRAAICDAILRRGAGVSGVYSFVFGTDKCYLRDPEC